MEVSISDDHDTVRRKRRDQGLHECEVFGVGPEAMESSRTWALCMKNPGHSGFIPYPEFGPEHLPCGWPTPEKMEVLRIIAEITVRLRVSYTSLGQAQKGLSHFTT
ncbi:hypothetical protein RRG08_064261 [Elysia crispata]|uniref:Uncharacterized protein n=1 Tax=Elysia crispata TaxID=231223 RepID=A0AAE1CS63_9GAST|nr:hypothetical protein RRG08_064261 [Elysia crispata]